MDLKSVPESTVRVHDFFAASATLLRCLRLYWQRTTANGDLIEDLLAQS